MYISINQNRLLGLREVDVMKRLVFLLLALSMVVSLCACGDIGIPTTQDGTQEAAKTAELSKEEMLDRV